MRLPLACFLPLALLACGKDDPDDDTGDPAVTDGDHDGVPTAQDCDDTDPEVGAPQTRWVDSDGDGFGDPGNAQDACPGDAGLVDNDYDCDDTDPGLPLYVDQATGSAGGSGSATDPMADIPSALAAGAACVVVGPGTYPGGLAVGADLVLASLEGAETTTLDAEGAGPVVDVTTGTVTIAGFTLTGGTGAPSGSDTLGGAVNGRGATLLRLQDCVVTGNSAKYGGGVFGPEAGVLELYDTVIGGNAATASGGGFYALALHMEGGEVTGNTGSYGGGGLLDQGEGSIEGTLFSWNEATQGGGLMLTREASLTGGSYNDNTAEKGGALYVAEGCAVTGAAASGNAAERGGGAYLEADTTLADTTFTGNTAATYGGGLHATGDATLSGLALEGNHAASLGGGALLASGTFTVSDLLVDGNDADSTGGGLYVYEATMIADGGEITGNSADFGGGVGLESAHFEDPAQSLTVSGNTAESYGGGAYLEGEGSWNGGSFGDNTALHGGGLFIGGISTLTGAYVGGNHATGNGGGLLADADASVTDTVFSGNYATDGAGLLIASTAQGALTACQVVGNQATGHGGGARVDGTLQSVATDWGADTLDNSPEDVWAGGAFDYDGTASFTCTAGGCS